jgi:hypothetical protein
MAAKANNLTAFINAIKQPRSCFSTILQLFDIRGLWYLRTSDTLSRSVRFCDSLTTQSCLDDNRGPHFSDRASNNFPKCGIAIILFDSFPATCTFRSSWAPSTEIVKC